MAAKNILSAKYACVTSRGKKLSPCAELGYKTEFYTEADTGKLNNIF